LHRESEGQSSGLAVWKMREAMSAEENLQRMKTLDDAWNAQDWEVFRKRHTHDTTVHWPGQPDPTRGIEAHHAESEAFFKSIENHLDNNPYRVMFGSGDWTCTIARWTGKMIGPWKGLDGKVHEATGKTFELEFCTVARWQDGAIVEENLFYDQVGFLRQIGVLWPPV
jgi:ketosteroid isomerase-like protein